MQREIEQIILSTKETRDFDALYSEFLRKGLSIKELLKFSIQNKEYPYPEYGTWLLTHIAEKDSSIAISIHKEMIDALFELENQSAIRNITKTLSFLEITEYRESEHLDLLISLIQNSDNKVACQVYSMRILIKFIQKYPELKKEIIEIIEINKKGKSNAYHSGFRKLMIEVS